MCVSWALSNRLRACSDVKYPMYTSIFCTIVCRIILSYLLGISLNLSVIGITLAMVGDWVIKAGFIIIKYLKGKWKEFQVV